jgi:transposase
MGKNMIKPISTNKSEKIGKKKYDTEFKQQVLDVCRSGAYTTIAECAKNYGINENTLHGWLRVSSKSPEHVENNSEIMNLKKELAKAKMELEILKKAAIYFANHAK